MSFPFRRLLVCSALACVAGLPAWGASDARVALGRRIFSDTNLSEPAGQACATCHAKAMDFSDPRNQQPTSRGANHDHFGPRNAPSAMYAAFSPPFQAGGDGGGGYLGGQFRDGRANALEDQAKGPPLNPIEMGNPSAAAVVAKLSAASYADDFKAIYGSGIFSDVNAAYNAMADAIATFERSHALSPFASKYDAWQRGETTLSDAEQRGMAVFNDPAKGNCAACHVSVSNNPGGLKPLFTDFGYDNIGVPRNPANRFYDMPPEFNPDGRNYVDIGLANVVDLPSTRGQFKAPSLRNIAVTGPYTHNGYFKTLRGLVDFYNTRDIKPRCADPFTSEAKALKQGCWPVAEVPETVNTVDMGHLGLSDQEVDDLVTFLGTLTDGWTPAAASR
jgi:cytochrome c peroxidase